MKHQTTWFARLQAEVADVAELDRKSTRVGRMRFEMIFDDGSALRVGKVADVRAEADRRRNQR
jgi:hypothetical protein